MCCALVVVALTPAAGIAGNSLTMQCTATLSVQSTPSFTWTPSTGSAQAITTSSTTKHMYSQDYSLGRLRESQDNSDITCRVCWAHVLIFTGMRKVLFHDKLQYRT